MPVAPKGSIVTIEGPSGAGKTTLVRRLGERPGFHPLFEAFDRLGREPDLDFRSERELLRLERTFLAEERRRYREALGRRAAGEIVVADTGFLGPLTYTAGLAAMGRASAAAVERLIGGAMRSERSWGVPDAIVYLDVPSGTRRARAAGDRAAHPEDLDRRHEAVGRFERSLYRAWAQGALHGRVRFVRSPGSAADLARRVGAFSVGIARRPVGRPPSLEGLLGPIRAVVRRSDRRSPALVRHR